MKVTIDIDEKTCGLLCKPTQVKPLMAALHELYGLIWAESCYDPTNEHTEKFANRLLPLIREADKILKFKT